MLLANPPARLATFASGTRNSYPRHQEDEPLTNPTKGILYTMTASSSPTPLLHLVVGYDGSPPASRALDAAALLLQGRTGRVAVVYVAHLSGIVIEAPVAAAETEPGFDQIEQELRAQAADQLRDRGVPWDFERRHGNIGEELGTVAADIGKANPSEFVMIVVGSSSSPIHRVAGSVAVGLGRHPPVPILIVP
jgi:nucleotide-binding universal stress UspA family protein